MRRKPAAAALALALLVGGCATGAAVDPMTDSLNPGRAANGENRDRLRAGLLIRVAASTAASGDLASAATLYRRATQIDPRNLAAVRGLGTTLARLGAADQAADAFRAALELAPEDAASLRGLANALIVLGQPAQAVTRLEAALAAGEDARIYNALGVANDMMGRHRAAQAHYRKGLALDAGNPALANNLGLSLAVSGDLDEAIRTLRKLAADPRATPRHRLNLALVLGLAGESAAAGDILRRYFDADAVRRNLAYYETLRALGDAKAVVAALGAHFAGISTPRPPARAP